MDERTQLLKDIMSLSAEELAEVIRRAREEGLL